MSGHKRVRDGPFEPPRSVEEVQAFIRDVFSSDAQDELAPILEACRNSEIDGEVRIYLCFEPP